MSLLKLKSAVLAPAVIALSACATIVGTPTQTIPISSTPSDAKIAIVDEAGAEVFKGATPTTVTLDKSTGRYFGGKSYKVTISKDGFKPQTIDVTASPNGWYIGGNLVFGGLIGYLAVDPFSGKMYTLSPDKITASLSNATASHNNTATDGSIHVVLLQDLSLDVQAKLVAIN